jgi:hypothetical protein
MLHIDNATPRRARQLVTYLRKFQIRPIDHPLYSPELVLSDCYLLVKLKGVLVGQEFNSTEEFLLAIRRVTDSIGRAKLESAFGAWERRLGERIQMKGE